ncbi:MAG: hypothetical protein ACYC37_10785, partial [Desulfobacteria bacterium]
MKITFRLVVSLVLVVALVAIGSSFYQVGEEKTRLTSELERRAIILAESLQESVVPLIRSDSPKRLNRIVQRFGNRERLHGIAVYDLHGRALASTSDLGPQIPETAPQVAKALTEGEPEGSYVR